MYLKIILIDIQYMKHNGVLLHREFVQLFMHIGNGYSYKSVQ